MDLSERLLSSPEFLAMVESVKQLIAESEPDSRAVGATLQAEKESLNQRRRGWLLSLSDPGLDHSVRMAIQHEYSAADQRQLEIDSQLGQLVSKTARLGANITPETVAGRLEQLETILEGENASAVNLELAQHIASIRCSPNGEVTVKLCILGAIADSADFVDAISKSGSTRPNSTSGRRRTKRNVAAAYEDDEAAETANNFAVDPERFAELGPEWFTEKKFQVPERQSWVEKNAMNVAKYRFDNKTTMEVTAKHFGKSVPTIRAALRIAQSVFGFDAFGKKISNSTWNCWFRINAHLVDEFLRQPGATIETAAKHFGKAEGTISKAKRLASEIARAVNATTVSTSVTAEDTDQD